MSEWQPIETAPRDGSWVDLWGFEGGTTGRRYPRVKWRDEIGFWVSSRDIFKKARFTHWMPLPAPPKSSTPGEA